MQDGKRIFASFKASCCASCCVPPQISKTHSKISKTHSKTLFSANRLADRHMFSGNYSGLYIQQDEQDGKFK